MNTDAAAFPAPYVGGNTIAAIADIPSTNPLSDQAIDHEIDITSELRSIIQNAIANAAIIIQTSMIERNVFERTY